MVKWLWIIRCILAFFVSAWGSRASANVTGRLQSAIINLFDNKSASKGSEITLLCGHRRILPTSKLL